MSQSLSQRFPGMMQSLAVYPSSQTPGSVHGKVKQVKKIRQRVKMHWYCVSGQNFHYWLTQFHRQKWLISEPAGSWVEESKPDLDPENLWAAPGFPFSEFCGFRQATNPLPHSQRSGLDIYHNYCKNKIICICEIQWLFWYDLLLVILLSNEDEQSEKTSSKCSNSLLSVPQSVLETATRDSEPVLSLILIQQIASQSA